MNIQSNSSTYFGKLMEKSIKEIPTPVLMTAQSKIGEDTYDVSFKQVDPQPTSGQVQWLMDFVNQKTQQVFRFDFKAIGNNGAYETRGAYQVESVETQHSYETLKEEQKLDNETLQKELREDAAEVLRQYRNGKKPFNRQEWHKTVN